MKAVTVYVTCESIDQARSIGKSLLQSRLVACVNILPKIQSLYWWNEDIQEDDETAFLAKTTQDKIDEIIKLTTELHSYDTPCIVALPIEEGHPDFIKWIAQETQK